MPPNSTLEKFEPPKRFENLPLELLLTICGYVPLHDLYYNIGQVCRNLRSITRNSSELWNKLQFTQRLSQQDSDDCYDDISHTLDCSSYSSFFHSIVLADAVHSVNYRGCAKHFEAQYLRYRQLPQGKYIVCDMYPLRHCQSVIVELRRSKHAMVSTNCFPFLKSLELPLYSIYQVTNICVSAIANTLEKLVLGNRLPDMGPVISLCAERLVHLKHFYFQSLGYLSRSGTEALVRMLSRLQSCSCCLDLSAFASVLGDLETEPLKNLVDFSVAFSCEERSISELVLVFSKLSCLNRLALNFLNNRPTDCELATFFQMSAASFQHLRMLDVDKAGCETLVAIADVFGNTSQHPGLSTLYVRCYVGSNMGLEAMVDKMTSLECLFLNFLRVPNSVTVDPSWANNFPEKLPKLSRIHLFERSKKIFEWTRST